MISTSQRVSSRSASNESKFLPTKSAVSPSLSTLLALLHHWHLMIKHEAQVISIDFVPPVWRHGPFGHHSLEANIGKFPNHIFIFSAFVRSLTPRSLTAFLEVSCSPLGPVYTLNLRVAPMRQSNAGRLTGCCLIIVCIIAINQDRRLQLHPRRYIKDSVTGMSVNDPDLGLFGFRGQRVQ
ncbi:hypothetical protein BDR05DRAFT_956245 [Suillus weaverae]|nr:hypothetical protein BDR05DRAFT_956245 [Suillus weaverae]